ncbi:Flp pilus assembly protein CpaB [Sandaracinus amylolyticus]|uniref:Flp pilus assembly protein RcpC/CpaB n=1 Tax=Sandaracinus amylolyticus TaxID=927083 RepID=A0A0F6W1N6_9BACT|nr:Flp pilus assembly protein CpaB [Sandaracinus amylolyticus]AKF05225.1 Flp pilus assembly protein RcpC/CpaB [Sandaracinus amylolyticus]
MKIGAFVASMIVALLGVGAMFVSMQQYQARTSGGAPVQVVIVTRDLAPGTVLTEDALGVRSMPESYVERRHVRPADVHIILGLRVRSRVETNESLVWSDVETGEEGARELSRLVRSGVRAVTLNVDGPSGFDGLLRAGDRVDVFHHTTRDGEGPVTTPLLQNVLVMAVRGNVGRGSEHECGGGSSQHVTLAATAEQSQVLLHADASGSIGLALRNPTDIAIADSLDTTTDGDLRDAERLRRLQSPVGADPLAAVTAPGDVRAD